MTTGQNAGPRSRWTPRSVIAFAGFAAVAAFYLWTEHREHLLGALPYLLFLACPLMHVLMHHGHGENRRHAATSAPQEPVEHRGPSGEGEILS